MSSTGGIAALRDGGGSSTAAAPMKSDPSSSLAGPNARMRAMRRSSMSVAEKAVYVDQLPEETTEKTSEQRLRELLARLQQIQMANEHWWNMFTWPALIVVEFTLYAVAESYRGVASELAPKAFELTGDEYIDFATSGRWLESAITITGFNVFLVWINTIKFAHRYILARERCPPPRDEDWGHMTEHDLAMNKKSGESGVSMLERIVIYCVSVALIVLGGASAQLIMFGSRVKAFRSLADSLVATLGFVRPAEMEEVHTARLVGPLLYAIWVALLLLLLYHVFIVVSSTLDEAVHPLRAKLDWMYDNSRLFHSLTIDSPGVPCLTALANCSSFASCLLSIPLCWDLLQVQALYAHEAARGGPRV